MEPFSLSTVDASPVPRTRDGHTTGPLGRTKAETAEVAESSYVSIRAPRLHAGRVTQIIRGIVVNLNLTQRRRGAKTQGWARFEETADTGARTALSARIGTGKHADKAVRAQFLNRPCQVRSPNKIPLGYLADPA